ncbi:MAG: V-type ATP synthase subunit E [Lachnospiraceae bacterium]|nr:V-type ATP synthase subunit E [Lachnospiraceae bacterium]
MAGIDNITKEILQDARAKAEGILSEAREKADAIRSASEEETAAILKQADENAAAESAKTRSRTASAAQMRARERRLSARQEIIDEVLQKAYDRLDGQSTKDYFAMIEKLLEANVTPGKGVISFGARDLGRLPKDFAERAAAIGKKHGAELFVSPTAENIDNGFILKYGGIEENCTLAALFAEKRDALRDQVNGILW